MKTETKLGNAGRAERCDALRRLIVRASQRSALPFLLFIFCFAASADTITFSFHDGAGNAISNTECILTPVSAPFIGLPLPGLTTADTVIFTTDPNGSNALANVQGGMYQGQLKSAKTTFFQMIVPGDGGTHNFISLLTNLSTLPSGVIPAVTNVSGSSNYLTITQSGTTLLWTLTYNAAGGYSTVAASTTGPVAGISASTNGSVIAIVQTNLPDPTVTSIYTPPTNSTPTTNATAIGSYADLTYNPGGFGHLSKALYTGANPSFVFFGDSTGADILPGMFSWLTAYTPAGFQLGAPFIGNAWSYFVFSSTVTFYSDYTYFWVPNGSVSLSPGTNGIYGGPSGGGATGQYIQGNRIQLFYYSSSTNGVATLSNSVDNVNWTYMGTITETSGTPEGTLQCTNFPVTLAGYTSKLTCISGTFRMPGSGFGIYNTNPAAGALIADLHAPGYVLSGWLLPGSNNLCCLLTNLNPTVTFYQQTKPISGYNLYQNYFAYMNNTNIVQCDNVLGSAQIGTSAGDPSLSAYQTLDTRGWAITNNAVFWDNYTPFSVRSNIVALGDNADTVIHLNAQGQAWAWQNFNQQVRFDQIYTSATNFYTHVGAFLANNNGAATNSSLVSPLLYPVNFSALAPVQPFGLASGYNGLTFASTPTLTNWAFGYGESQDQLAIHGKGGIVFGSGTGGVQFGYGFRYGYLWPDGGWSFEDLVNSGDGNNDPGGPGNVRMINLTVLGGVSNTPGTSITSTNTSATLSRSINPNGTTNYDITAVSGGGSSSYNPTNFITNGAGEVSLVNTVVTNNQAAGVTLKSSLTINGGATNSPIDFEAGSSIVELESGPSALTVTGEVGLWLSGNGNGVHVSDGITGTFTGNGNGITNSVVWINGNSVLAAPMRQVFFEASTNTTNVTLTNIQAGAYYSFCNQGAGVARLTNATYNFIIQGFATNSYVDLQPSGMTSNQQTFLSDGTNLSR